MTCDYGCGRTANVTLANGQQCCSTHYQQCPEARKAAREATLAVSVQLHGPIDERTEKRKARARVQSRRVTENRHKNASFPEGALCFYGCGKTARFPIIMA